MTFLDFLTYFLQVSLLPLLPLLICGLSVALVELLFQKAVGRGLGRGVVIATSIVGTPIHEAGHAFFCLLFGHKITEAKFWQPPSKQNGVLGYVSHSYNKKNLWQNFGNLLIGLGPIGSGMAVISLILFFCYRPIFEGGLHTFSSLAASASPSLADFWDGIKNTFALIPAFFTYTGSPLWARIVGTILIFAICLHINLSPADIKGSLSSLPIYLLLTLAFSGVTFLISLAQPALPQIIVSALWNYNGFVFSCFSFILLFAGILLALAFLLFLLRKIFRLA